MSEVGAVSDREQLIAAARGWIAGDPDPDTRAELEMLVAQGAHAELAERFSGPLAFGTAGLRGIVGAGLSRFNRAVVIRATRGLGDFLSSHRSGARNLPVVIGYDARPGGLRFAADAASVLLAMGIPVRVFEREVPTPLVAYAARVLNANAAIMITASHNPREYNGYKVFLDEAIQLTSPADEQIARAIAAVGPAAQVPRVEIGSSAEALGKAAEPLPAALFERYLHEIELSLPRSTPSDLCIAYTPLHGVGWRYARRALERAGFSQVKVTPEQAEPDGTFPTTPFPNPEEPGSLDLALAFAQRERAELLLANDPDADRLSAAVPTPSGRYVQLSGNQIGVLLCDALLAHAREGGVERGLVVASIVSTPLLGKLARARGAHFEATLTGFKWIWSAARALELEGAGRFVFACEEALGYSVSAAVRDKDGISAAVALARVAARLKLRQQTLLDRLGELYRELGLWVSVQHNIAGAGASGALSLRTAVERLATHTPVELAGRKVTSLSDFRQAKGRPRWLGSAELVELHLEGGGRVLVRPSGTEPKLKVYVDLETSLGSTESWSALEEQARREALEVARAVEAALALT